MAQVEVAYAGLGDAHDAVAAARAACEGLAADIARCQEERSGAEVGLAVVAVDLPQAGRLKGLLEHQG
jgi:hypothetical protein